MFKIHFQVWETFILFVKTGLDQKPQYLDSSNLD